MMEALKRDHGTLLGAFVKPKHLKAERSNIERVVTPELKNKMNGFRSADITFAGLETSIYWLFRAMGGL